MADIFSKIASNSNNLGAWQDLFSFGARILRVPVRAGKKHNLTALIKKRLNGEESDNQSDAKARHTKLDRKAVSRAALVRSKLEDGNVSAAVRILCSDEGFAPYCQDTVSELRKKHPAAPDNVLVPDPAATSELQVSEQDVLKAVRSFPPGSAGGPDGIRPQHILELCTSHECAAAFLTPLTSFMNLLLRGQCPPEVQPILFGGRLLALAKKDGGIRPIAVGYTLRRLTAKCANSFAVASLRSYLVPTQVGAGVPGGCEAAVHAVRRFVESMPRDYAVVKLDFANAFNCLDRSHMLNEVYRKIPELYKFCHLAYAHATDLQFGDWRIQSQVGVQQGDPLGPTLFCIGIQPLLDSMSCPLRVAFLDDITLGGDTASLERDVQLVRLSETSLGLRLNDAKCELVSPSVSVVKCSPLSSFTLVEPSCCYLLGAPLFADVALEQALLTRLRVLSRAAERLRDLFRHDALTILRFALCAPKLMHLLRSAPCFGHALLQEFDNMFRACLCSIVNADLSDSQWLQASLPVGFGGLGIRLVSQLASSAFLASAVGTSELQSAILSACHSVGNGSFDQALALWSGDQDLNVPLESKHKQKTWDVPVIKKCFGFLKESLSDPVDQARLLAVSSHRAGEWLKALPISSCGLLLDDEAIRVAVGLRLGAKLCVPHTCLCGSEVDARGLHGLSCKRSAGRISRHHNMNEIVWRALTRAGIPSTKEPTGLSWSDSRRPDGLTLIPWSSGRCAAWDVTVVDTVARSYLHLSAQSAGGSAEAAATRKRDKYMDLSSSFEIIPVAFETFGPVDAGGAAFLDAIGRKITQRTGDLRETSFLWQRLSVTLQRFNAVCFRDTFNLELLDDS